MNHVFPFVGLLLFSAVLMLFIANYSWKKRAIAGAKPLALLTLCAFFWTFGYAMELLGISLSWMVFWNNFKLLGLSFVATGLFFFVLDYSGYEKWMQRRVIFLFLVIPTISYLLILSNSYHQLIYVGQPQLDIALLPTLLFEFGTLWWIKSGYDLLLSLLSCAILVHQYFYASKVYRRQISIILLGFTIPLLGTALSILNIVPFRFLDFTAFLLVFSGLIISMGVFRFGLLDLTPITHTAVLESILEGIIVLDRSDRVLDINSSATMLLNLPTDNVIGYPLAESFPIWDSLSEICHQTGRVTVDIERDDTLHYLQFRCKPIATARQQSDVILLVVHDNTDHILAEQFMVEKAATLENEVAAHAAKIHVNQERSDIILSNIQDGITMADVNGVVNYVNPAFTELTGYSEDDLIGIKPGELLAESVSDSMWPAFNEAARQNRPWRGELRIKRKDGQEYDAEVLFAPIRDENGYVVGSVSSHRDVSKQKNLENARTQFINNISHQLRTPLTNLKLYSELMQMDLPAEKQQQYQTVLVQQIERLEKVIQDVLYVSAFFVGEEEQLQDAVDIEELLKTAVSQHQEQADKKQVTIITQIEVTFPAIIGDRKQLQKAIDKLIDNAIIFTPENGTITIATATTTDSAQNWLHIAIKDEGPGITAAEQTQIFERFFRGQLAESGKVPGAGLGLSIADQIIRTHGGSIDVASVEGQGSTFTINLPLSE